MEKRMNSETRNQVLVGGQWNVQGALDGAKLGLRHRAGCVCSIAAMSEAPRLHLAVRGAGVYSPGRFAVE